MPLPDIVAIKLGAYTLFCHQLLAHLRALDDATHTDKRLTCGECCRRFDESLHQFFQEADPHDLKQAASELGDSILGRVALFRGQNHQAASTFDAVVEAARSAALTWSYQNDLETWHQHGRKLARHFYIKSPWPVTQARLTREAQLKVIFDEGSKIAFRESYPDEETSQELKDVILVRFVPSRECDWYLYLAYPYLFMHEYVSHVFALDHGNERFNDGWLSHAAAKFMARHSWDADLNLQPPLAGVQSDAFWEQFNRMKHVPRDACSRARRFDVLLRVDECFQEMMWELAAFEPRVGESPFWPDQFVNRLEQVPEAEFEHLRRKIAAAPNLRELYGMLP